MRIRDLLARDPFREIKGVIKITEHNPREVWWEMDEYVPTEKVRQAFIDILETLLDTKRGASERTCIWVSGFFGSGKSHFLKVLGYLLEDHELEDTSGRKHSSQDLLCRKLGLENYLPHLKQEFKIKVLFINLLDHDPQNPKRPTISRLVCRNLFEIQGLSRQIWVARWEQELKQLGKWQDFLGWVRKKFNRPWEEERKLNAESILKQALPHILPDRYRSEDEASRAIENSKNAQDEAEPSSVVRELREFARNLDEHKGRVVVLLDEIGLYVGDDLTKLTDLKSLAEKVVEEGKGKVLLVVSAQEALRELVHHFSKEEGLLSYLQDRFRIKIHLEPTEVQQVVTERLLKKNPEGAEKVRQMLDQKRGQLRSMLTIESWNDSDFIEQYPCHPYSIRLIQSIVGAFRSSIEEARRASGTARSILQIVHDILNGKGNAYCGAEQPLGWLVPLDLFYDVLGLKDGFRSEHVKAMDDIEQLGEVDGLPVVRVAKALFLLQQVATRYPCNLDNLTSVLVDDVNTDVNSLRERVKKVLQKLQKAGWVAEEENKFKLLTPEQHMLEEDINRNRPDLAEMKSEMINLLKDLLRDFRYEHGTVRRQLDVEIVVDDEVIHRAKHHSEVVPSSEKERGLKVALFSPLHEITEEEILKKSIEEPNTVFWRAGDSSDSVQLLERSIALKKTLNQWKTKGLSSEQERYKEHIEKESDQILKTRLPILIEEAFKKGEIYINGQQIRPNGKDVQTILKNHLRDIAGKIYNSFIDKRPSKDEECAEVLVWQSKSALPKIYTELGLLTSDQQLKRDNEYLSIVRGEISRRQNLGLERTGKALLEHFEKPPYGWDERLVRLFVATLVKLGLVSVQYQGRFITEPTDQQLRSIFSSSRDFGKVTLEILPEVDWRKASELCAEIFGVTGSDTFDRTANTVGEQVQKWGQTVSQLKLRCQDNRLPEELVQLCDQVSKILNEITHHTEPNSRLSSFLKHSEDLRKLLPKLKRLERFDFESYKRLKTFIQLATDWAQTLKDENLKRWEHLVKGAKSSDLLDLWQSLKDDFTVLFKYYLEDYAERHREFQAVVSKTIEELRKHPAFQHDPNRAESILNQLEGKLCSGDGTPSEESFRCPECQMSFDSMTPASVHLEKQKLIEELNLLLPRPVSIRLEPLNITKTILSETDVESITGELLRYLKLANGPIRVQMNAYVEWSDDDGKGTEVTNSSGDIRM